MPKVCKNLLVPFTSQQMYSLVNNIEAYPEFLPWCIGTKVHERSSNQVKATLDLGKGPIKHSITTLNTMRPFDEILMQYVAGPFKQCVGKWQFMQQNSGDSCQVIFEMQYEFNSKLKALTLEPVFAPIANSLVDAFIQRAHQTYAK